MSGYVYIKSEPGLWTVGFYDPSGKWHAASDHDKEDEAAQETHWLNGGKNRTPKDAQEKVDRVAEWLEIFEDMLDCLERSDPPANGHTHKVCQRARAMLKGIR